MTEDRRARWAAREFPSTVSVRFAPDAPLAACQALLPQAKQVLARALAFEASGQPIVKLFLRGTDGSLIYAYLHGPVKHLYIQPAVGGVPVLAEEEEAKRQEALACPDMLSGVIVPGTLVETGAHAFHPTTISAELYQLIFDWQDVDRLGVGADATLGVSATDLQAHWPKPSSYSGAMKRVVAAIYGIAKTAFVPGGGINFEVAFDTVNHYDYRWERTDGIHRSGSTCWLIRISKEDGVLAMPLPLFECTTDRAFRDELDALGDIETRQIVDEFGGLPTGETFPIGDELAAAISEGTVARLLSADSLTPFYDRKAYFDACGWAFSESGAAGEAHNTCWWYSRPDIALATDYFNDGWVKDGFANGDPFDRYMRSEHWKISIALPDLAESSDVTIARADLTLVNAQPVEAPNHGIGSVEEMFQIRDGLGAEEMYGRRMEGGGTPPAPELETLMPLFRTGYHDWITGVDEYEVDEEYVDSSDVTRKNVHGLGCLMASGFNPLTFEKHQTRDVSSGGPVTNTVTFWAHSALMLVPTNSWNDTDSEKLTRFKFWGRSQANIKLRYMEPSRPAPVYVFFNGEDLEIVYREAERFNTDLSGGFQAGDFWATSMDLRGKVTNHPRYFDDRTVPRTRALQTLFKIGLIIPAGLREGYAMMQFMFGPAASELAYPPAAAVWKPHAEMNSIKWFLFVPGIDDNDESGINRGRRECSLQYHQPRYPADAPDAIYKISGIEYRYSEIGVMPYMWWWQWTSEFYDLGAVANAYQRAPRHLSKSKGISWGASISGRKKWYYTNDGPELGFNPWDFPWWYFWESTIGGFVIDQIPPPPPLFAFRLPEAIATVYRRDPRFEEFTDVRPSDVTFIGGL